MASSSVATRSVRARCSLPASFLVSTPGVLVDSSGISCSRLARTILSRSTGTALPDAAGLSLPALPALPALAVFSVFLVSSFFASDLAAALGAGISVSATATARLAPASFSLYSCQASYWARNSFAACALGTAAMASRSGTVSILPVLRLFTLFPKNADGLARSRASITCWEVSSLSELILLATAPSVSPGFTGPYSCTPVEALTAAGISAIGAGASSLTTAGTGSLAATAADGIMGSTAAAASDGTGTDSFLDVAGTSAAAATGTSAVATGSLTANGVFSAATTSAFGSASVPRGGSSSIGAAAATGATSTGATSTTGATSGALVAGTLISAAAPATHCGGSSRALYSRIR